MLPLSKVFDPVDLEHEDLAEALVAIDATDALKDQYAVRRWEYALAMRAYELWYTAASRPLHEGPIVDVGGGGSHFWKLISDRTPVVDPKEGYSLEAYLQTGPRLASAVFCLSVIEHVDDLDRFLYHLGCLVAPGGLLFLTTDCRENVTEGTPDDRHFHWDRTRIFNSGSLRAVQREFIDFQPFGAIDLTYTQPFENWGYTVASLCLRKQP